MSDKQFEPQAVPVDINALFRALGRIEAGQTAILSELEKQGQRIDDHDGRIAKSEKFRAWLMGGAAGVSAMVTAVFHFLGVK